MNTRQTVNIDANVTVDDLITSWKNGNKSDVIDKLKTDHPGLVAMMIVQGAQDKSLSLSDCNEIANRLVDTRRELLLASE